MFINILKAMRGGLTVMIIGKYKTKIENESLVK